MSDLVGDPEDRFSHDEAHFIIDIDECALFPNLCVNGVCENGVGMFRCNCKTGFQPDSTGGNCTGMYYIPNTVCQWCM